MPHAPDRRGVSATGRSSFCRWRTVSASEREKEGRRRSEAAAVAVLEAKIAPRADRENGPDFMMHPAPRTVPLASAGARHRRRRPRFRPLQTLTRGDVMQLGM